MQEPNNPILIFIFRYDKKNSNSNPTKGGVKMEDKEEINNQRIHVANLARTALNNLETLRNTIERFPDIEMQVKCINHILEITQEVKGSYEKFKQTQEKEN